MLNWHQRMVPSPPITRFSINTSGCVGLTLCSACVTIGRSSGCTMGDHTWPTTSLRCRWNILQNASFTKVMRLLASNRQIISVWSSRMERYRCSLWCRACVRSATRCSSSALALCSAARPSSRPCAMFCSAERRRRNSSVFTSTSSAATCPVACTSCAAWARRSSGWLNRRATQYASPPSTAAIRHINSASRVCKRAMGCKALSSGWRVTSSQPRSVEVCARTDITAVR